MVTSFSSLLKRIESNPSNLGSDKEEELYCATAFITLLQAGLLTHEVGKSDDGFTQRQDGLDYIDAESQCALKCLEKIMHYDLPEAIFAQLTYFKPTVEELSKLNHYMAINNSQMQKTLSAALNKKKSQSGCMLIMLMLTFSIYLFL